MKIKITLFPLLLVLSSCLLYSQPSKTFTAADYDRAVAMLNGNASSTVENRS
ncbi:MAG: hypothetical protein K9J37_02395 [Saprospiraceae bacterium]|nr:hypothetical protein [Saprospiraceae bacterium]MCF8248729.1 hypothetical protein [Saprospiraceae bacterium]MCF8278781.1 hypothetical protein [Bacteroidales bacterium]MCF8310581.1 hypothetical protein [Saprospiraceae bacterium]MCF8439140.1 hypothetical protein [Saprospiraceae bacterium]